jgi:uncharacterized protein (UPF0548 family)
MSDERMLGPPAVRRRLAELERAPLNFDPVDLRGADPPAGWRLTDLCQELRPEPPGPPVDDRTFRVAQRLMRGYEFADPSIVRAYYDPGAPMEGRTMLLELRALTVLRLRVGVRVGEIYERTCERDGREALVWGWNYRTLEGHVEMGQMDWQVWKWLDSGAVEFRVHAISRTAPIANPFVRVGFHLLRGRERSAFLQSTGRRMRAFTDLALESDRPGLSVREAAAELTARPAPRERPVHDEVARRAGRQTR